MKPIICLITATKNRHKQLERVVRFVLDQNYDGKIYHLIYNNSSSHLRLNSNLDQNKFILVNNCISYNTGSLYVNLGQIYNDCLTHIPTDTNIVNIMDDDDIYLPNHVQEGVNGMLKGGKLAYKPEKSYFKQKGRISLVNNILEPSMFVDYHTLMMYGFSEETTAQHHKWITPIVNNNQFFVDPEGIPTYICDWSQEISTFKTSGNPHNPDNFKKYEEISKDNGDGIITPCSKTWGDHYCRIK